jgi:hypothetical protein
MIIDKILGVLPAGSGTYLSLAAGLIVTWLLVLFPDAGSAVGFEGGVDAGSAWKATWAAMVAAYGRRAIK